MSAYTEGPWDFDEGDLSVYQLETLEPITGALYEIENPKTRSNARLIAAAPELLEALNAFPMLLAPATSAWGKEVQEWQYKASAAIAKAEGR